LAHRFDEQETDMKFSIYAFAVLFTATASTQLAWSDGPKSYPRDYFETHQKSEPVSAEDRTTASVSKDESAPAKADDVSDFHEGAGPSGKFYGGHASRF
jgi:hypothetical protein